MPATLTTQSFDYAAAGIEKADARMMEMSAKEIGRQKTHAGETIVKTVIAIGRELAAARTKFKAEHERSFCRWATDRCGIPKTNAYRFIAAFEAFGNCPTVEQIDLSAVYLLSGAGCPEEITLAAIERSKTERITKAEASEMIANGMAVEPDDPPERDPQPRPTINVPTPATQREPEWTPHGTDAAGCPTDDDGATEGLSDFSSDFDSLYRLVLDWWQRHRDVPNCVLRGYLNSIEDRIEEEYQ